VSAIACAPLSDPAAFAPQEDFPPLEVIDLITPSSVIASSRTTDKLQLLQELAMRAARMVPIDSQTIIDALRSREILGSTGVGQGIALPHARVPGLQQFFGLFARLERPIEFEAVDKRPVDLVFLLLIPEQAGDDHLAALACVSRKLRNPAVAQALRAAKTAPELYKVLTVGSDTA
jgi:nitrogen PTS system EIIA component